MTRYLTFHFHGTTGNEARMSPSAYYVESNYTPVAVRIYAETAPTRDAKFDIFDDGVSIFNNRTPYQQNLTTGVVLTGAPVTACVLPIGQNTEESAEDFSASLIEVGSWVYCNILDSGGGKNFTVQLELYSQAEEQDEEE